jgi:hypothetical protein
VDNFIFILHGHQASYIYSKYNTVFGYLLRYLANPLGLKNSSVSHDDEKKKHVESILYEFSSKNGIISVIGHTHRPLFESLSNRDSLRFRIENLVREYPSAGEKRAGEIQDEITEIKTELLKDKSGLTKHRDEQGSIYNRDIVIPCLFNSGGATGKKGFTGIEIENGKISLIHWYKKELTEKKKFKNLEKEAAFEGSNFIRSIVKSDSLDYIFTRIKLLG